MLSFTRILVGCSGIRTWRWSHQSLAQLQIKCWFNVLVSEKSWYTKTLSYKYMYITSTFIIIDNRISNRRSIFFFTLNSIYYVYQSVYSINRNKEDVLSGRDRTCFSFCRRSHCLIRCALPLGYKEPHSTIPILKDGINTHLPIYQKLIV